MKRMLEICCPDVDAAILAEQCGADRVELCTNLSVGGTTPSEAEIISAKQKLQIPIHVLIRIHGGNFVYDEIEINQMIEQIEFCKKHNIEGVVIGALAIDNSIQIEQTKKMIDAAKPMNITFHKAFDECKNPFEALETLINIGVGRILTSGQKPTSLEGAETLNKLITQANGRIKIMPGGGIRSSNLLPLLQIANASEVHSAAGILNGIESFKTEVKSLKILLQKN